MTDTIQEPRASEAAEESRVRPGGKTLALTRIALSLVFLWPALDKTFGLGYATPSGQAWIDGKSPTSGYLMGQEGTFGSLFSGMSGNALVDVLFIGGMAAVGVALLLGIGMRLAAFGATCLMGMLYLSAMPLANNPVMDEHLVYVVLAIALAASRAGDTLGFGAKWGDLGLVRSMPWLK
ncbi:hypothetical protein [Salininema proteolyticum]|uniref:Thiosulfate dehydrogenase [quinone] large subunit n=1 Tax=Salininema proteolyticum TaxID=1607685 RepID=A0ABV8U0V2_9ACTN